MEVFIVVEQFDLCTNNVILVAHSEKLNFLICLFLRCIVLLFVFFYFFLLNFLILVYIAYKFVLTVFYSRDLSILVQETNTMFFVIFKGTIINISI